MLGSLKKIKMYKLFERIGSYLRTIRDNQIQTFDFVAAYQADLLGNGDNLNFLDKPLAPLEKLLEEDGTKRV